MSREMCPRCRTVQNMDVSSATRSVPGSDGKEKRVKTLSYHCEQCRQFVRSEEREEAPGK